MRFEFRHTHTHVMCMHIKHISIFFNTEDLIGGKMEWTSHKTRKESLASTMTNGVGH